MCMSAEAQAMCSLQKMVWKQKKPVSVIFEIEVLTSYGHSEMALRANSLHTEKSRAGEKSKF